MKRALAALAAATLSSAIAPTSATADSMSRHAVTFSGPYSPKAGTANSSTVCHAAANTGSVNTCRFTFDTPRNACVAEPTTNPVIGRLYIGPYGLGVNLYKMGGGVLEGHGIDFGGGTPTVYDVHVSVEGICDDTTLPNIIDPGGLVSDVSNGSYMFSGHANA